MSRWRFALAVGVTSIALVAVLAVVGLLTVRSVVASAAPWAGGYMGPAAFGGPGFQLPQELQGLGSLPPSERFAHFVGVQVTLKDKDNKPLTVNVTPGTASSATVNSLAIAANDGTSKTFTLSDSTAIKNMSSQQGSSQPATASIANGDQVVVVTLNNDTTARAVIDGGKDGFGAGGPHGWGGWHR